MKNFTYYRPTTVEQAVGLLGNKWGPAEILAGGTDLLDLQKEYVAQPDKVISVTAIKDLAGIKAEGGAITIGAATKLADIAADAGLKKNATALTDAASIVGGPQIRNMGTLGGNLCQRNRCWYFRDEHVNCFLKGAKCFAARRREPVPRHFHAGAQVRHRAPSHWPPRPSRRCSADVQGPRATLIKLAEFFHAPARQRA